MHNVNPVVADAFVQYNRRRGLLEKAAAVVMKISLQKFAQKIQDDMFLYGNSFVRLTPNGAEVLDPKNVMLKVNA